MNKQAVTQVVLIRYTSNDYSGESKSAQNNDTTHQKHEFSISHSIHCISRKNRVQRIAQVANHGEGRHSSRLVERSLDT